MVCDMVLHYQRIVNLHRMKNQERLDIQTDNTVRETTATVPARPIRSSGGRMWDHRSRLGRIGRSQNCCCRPNSN